MDSSDVDAAKRFASGFFHRNPGCAGLTYVTPEGWRVSIERKGDLSISAAKERVAAVSWLRFKARERCRARQRELQDVLSDAADEIEKGEHT